MKQVSVIIQLDGDNDNDGNDDSQYLIIECYYYVSETQLCDIWSLEKPCEKNNLVYHLRDGKMNPRKFSDLLMVRQLEIDGYNMQKLGYFS